MNAPQITASLKGIEHDVEFLYSTKPIEKYEQRRKELKAQRDYARQYHDGNTSRKVFIDLDDRIKRLDNIINNKTEQENAQGNTSIQQTV